MVLHVALEVELARGAEGAVGFEADVGFFVFRVGMGGGGGCGC